MSKVHLYDICPKIAVTEIGQKRTTNFFLVDNDHKRDSSKKHTLLQLLPQIFCPSVYVYAISYNEMLFS